MEIKILSKSGSSKPHTVTFRFKDGKYSVDCSCQDAQQKPICMHKIALMNGDKSMLYDSAQESDLNKAIELIQKAEFPKMNI